MQHPFLIPPHLLRHRMPHRKALSLQQQSDPKRLTFIKEADWDPEKTYNKDPAIYLCYSIEWKVKRMKTGPDKAQNSLKEISYTKVDSQRSTIIVVACIIPKELEIGAIAQSLMETGVDSHHFSY